MARALRLARKGLYTTDPNPRVGCVIADGERVIGQGWHQYAGGSHAEVAALQDTGKPVTGTTAYVTLEPCSYHGRTPPCTDALLEAGVSRVVVASGDPKQLTASFSSKNTLAASANLSGARLASMPLAEQAGAFVMRNIGLELHLSHNFRMGEELSQLTEEVREHREAMPLVRRFNTRCLAELQHVIPLQFCDSCVFAVLSNEARLVMARAPASFREDRRRRRRRDSGCRRPRH